MRRDGSASFVGADSARRKIEADGPGVDPASSAPVVCRLRLRGTYRPEAQLRASSRSEGLRREVGAAASAAAVPAAAVASPTDVSTSTPWHCDAAVTLLTLLTLRGAADAAVTLLAWER